MTYVVNGLSYTVQFYFLIFMVINGTVMLSEEFLKPNLHKQPDENCCRLIKSVLFYIFFISSAFFLVLKCLHYKSNFSVKFQIF